MYISAYSQRQQLFHITERWLSDRLEPDDALQITRIITYDSFIAWHTLVDFAQDLTRRLGHPKVRALSLYRKKDLKDSITRSAWTDSPRVAALLADYRRMPEFYYTGSPMAGFLFHDPSGRPLSICRFKRIKRIAEKASRYAVLHVRERLRQQSAALCPDGAAASWPEENLPPDAAARAEAETIAAIRRTGLHLPQRAMEIQDVVGTKVVDWGFGDTGLEATIAEMPGAEILEKEIHQGVYNATHYVVRLNIETGPVVAAFSASPHRQTCLRRGLLSRNGTADFEAFLHGGASDLRLDLILTTYEELLESELGRSMHEARIFRQRQERTLLGNIPLNIEYIIEYLLAVGLSPVTKIDEIPIKLWGRYLPDTLSYCIRKLYGISEYTLIDD